MGKFHETLKIQPKPEEPKPPKNGWKSPKGLVAVDMLDRITVIEITNISEVNPNVIDLIIEILQNTEPEDFTTELEQGVYTCDLVLEDTATYDGAYGYEYETDLDFENMKPINLNKEVE